MIWKFIDKVTTFFGLDILELCYEWVIFISLGDKKLTFDWSAIFLKYYLVDDVSSASNQKPFCVLFIVCVVWCMRFDHIFQFILKLTGSSFIKTQTKNSNNFFLWTIFSSILCFFWNAAQNFIEFFKHGK